MPLESLKLTVGVLIAATLYAQPFTNSSLRGKYYARHILISPSGSGFNDMRSLGGAITFDGNGGYGFTGSQSVGAGGPQNFTSSGTYSLSSNGFLTVSNLLRANTNIEARFTPQAIVGSSTEVAGRLYDVFVAIPAPAAPVTVESLNGDWRAAGVEFINAATAISRATFFSFRPAAVIPAFSVTGQASNLGRRPVTQSVSGASLTLAGDGSGTFNCPLGIGTSAASTLLSGQRNAWISADGRILLAGSREVGSHDLIVAVRGDTGVTQASLKDLFFTSGLQLNGTRPNSHVGSANSAGQGTLVQTRRVRTPEGPTDFSGVNRYSVQSDGQGLMEINRIALGAGGTVFLSSGVSLVDGNNYELTIGVKAAAFPSSGAVFVSPYGVTNAASFAPVGNPIAPGGYVALFGAGLAAAPQVATSYPFPLTLGGVQVLVNGVAAPIHSVSASQVNALVPYSTGIGTARVAVVNGPARSADIEVRVAATAPGVFPGAIVKPNFSVISPQNPARRGDTIIIFLTGLGAVTPATADGAAAAANPLSLVNAPVNVYIGGERATVSFKGLAPGFAGLYQLNVAVPATAPSGANVPVGIETPEAFHDQAVVAIAP